MPNKLTTYRGGDDGNIVESNPIMKINEVDEDIFNFIFKLVSSYFLYHALDTTERKRLITKAEKMFCQNMIFVLL